MTEHIHEAGVLPSLEKDAAIARVRAERRCGLLLLEMEKGTKTSTPNEVISPYRNACENAGINKDQSSKWQSLAKVDEQGKRSDLFPEERSERPADKSCTQDNKPQANLLSRARSDGLCVLFPRGTSVNVGGRGNKASPEETVSKNSLYKARKILL